MTWFDGEARAGDGLVPLPHCGVTFFFGHYDESRDAWLYQHSRV